MHSVFNMIYGPTLPSGNNFNAAYLLSTVIDLKKFLVIASIQSIWWLNTWKKSKHKQPDEIKYLSRVTKQKHKDESEAETCKENGQIDKREGEG